MKCKYEQNILVEAEKRPRTSTLLTAGTCTLISPLAFVANLLGSVSSLNKNNVNLISLSLAYFLYDYHFYNAASPNGPSPSSSFWSVQYQHVTGI